MTFIYQEPSNRDAPVRLLDAECMFVWNLDRLVMIRLCDMFSIYMHEVDT